MGGDGIGASFEQSLTTEWGVTDTEETKRAESESKSVEQSVSIDETAPPEAKTLILVNTTTAATSTPFDINAAMTFECAHGQAAITIQWRYWTTYNSRQQFVYAGTVGQFYKILHPGNKNVTVSSGWTTERCPAYLGVGGFCYYKDVTLKFTSIEDVVAKFTGKSVDWPGTLNQHIPSSVHSAVERIFDKASRTISMTGIQHRVADGVVAITTQDVTGEDTQDVLDRHGIDETHCVGCS